LRLSVVPSTMITFSSSISNIVITLSFKNKIRIVYSIN
jgi:hypothetical protein